MTGNFQKKLKTKGTNEKEPIWKITCYFIVNIKKEIIVLYVILYHFGQQTCSKYTKYGFRVFNLKLDG